MPFSLSALSSPSLKTRITVFTLLVFLVGMWSVTLHATRVLREDSERLLGGSQYAAVALVAAQIGDDVDFRLRALERLAADVTPELLDDPASLQGFLERSGTFQSLFNGGTRIARADGRLRASVPYSEERMRADYSDRDYMAGALREGRTTIGRPVIGKVLRTPVIGIAAPIRDRGGRVIGAVVGSIDLGKPNFFDRVAGGGQERGGSYLVFAPEHRLIVTASERGRAMTAAPAPGVNLMYDRYVAGYEGYGVAVSSRGVEELSAAQRIGGTGWLLVYTLPAEIAFAPVRALQQRLLAAGVLVSLLAGGLTWLVLTGMLRRQFAPMLAATRSLDALAAAGQPPPPLPITRDDEVGQLLAAFNRLTARLGRREAELHDSEAKLALILDNVDAGIYMKDRDSRYLFANRRARELFGATGADVIGRRDADLFDAATAAALHDYDQRVLRDGKPLRFEETRHKLDGSEVVLLSVKLPLHDDAGAVTGLCGISTDITELGRYRRQLEDLVAARTAELTAARDAAEAASRAKSAFLANMSHELRTPLAAIMGMTEVARRGSAEPRLLDQLGKIDLASQRLLGVINDILDLSRIEAGRMTLERVEFAFGQVLEQLLAMFGDGIAAKGLKLRVEVAPEVARARFAGDPLRLGQVLVNLVGNAIKFTERGFVAVAVRIVATDPAAMLLRCEVRDTGIGIAAADCGRLFRPFEQVDASSTRRFGGTGLGLAISKRLVELMGGEIGVDSVPGEGSCFWFTVRLERAGAAPVAAVAAGAVSVEESLRQRYGGTRILLAEDDPMAREVALSLLEGAGLVVDVAEDGRRAVELAAAGNYPLILMDMQMPGLSGVEATRAIRARPGGVAAGIVAMTASAYDEDRRECLAAGMDDHIAKPVEPDRLFAKVMEWLERRSPQAAADGRKDNSCTH